jgi:hypothetical protein
MPAKARAELLYEAQEGALPCCSGFKEEVFSIEIYEDAAQSGHADTREHRKTAHAVANIRQTLTSSRLARHLYRPSSINFTDLVLSTLPT